MTDKDRVKYLLGLSYVDKFLDLYDKWSFKDSKGIRSNFECSYSNKIFNPVSKFRTTMPDPVMVATIERSLGKKLTDEEKANEAELWREGNIDYGVYFRDYKKGRAKVKIPQLIFPTSFL